MEEDFIFTTEEFLKLIEIQRHFLTKIILLENERFELGMNKLNNIEKQTCIKIKNNLLESIEKNIEDWINNERFTKGLTKAKDIFWRAHHFVLIPILYKEYLDITPVKLKSQYSQNAINQFLFRKYPFLKDSLKNIYLNYCEMREQYKKHKLAEKLEYGNELPKDINIPDNFTIATLFELHKEIQNFNIESNNLMRDNIIKNMLLNSKSQFEIMKQLESQNIKTSQSTISRIIKKIKNGQL